MLVSRRYRGRGAGEHHDAIREYLAVIEDQLRGEEIREIEVAV